MKHKHSFRCSQERQSGDALTLPAGIPYRFDQSDRGAPAPRRAVHRRALRTSDVTRYVFVQRARCPHCGEPSLRKYRTNPPETDGSRTSYALCAAEGCGWTGFLIEE